MIQISLVSLCLLLTFYAKAGEPRFYRYTADNGVMVISSRIPARYVVGGYDVISQDGRLLKRVSPELSLEEKQRVDRKKKERAHFRAWDEELLLLYSRSSDIEAAKKRKLLAIKNDLELVSRNIEKIDEEIDRYQNMAADDERIGREVSTNFFNNIAILKQDRSQEEKRLQKKLEEEQKITERYDRDIDRFKKIMSE